MANREHYLQRYDELVMERYWFMLAGKAFKATQQRWLKVLEQKGPFESIDDWGDANEMLKSQSPDLWWELQVDAGALSESCGIASWQVIWALFVEDFDDPGLSSQVSSEARGLLL